jgi:hypothetical protein
MDGKENGKGMSLVLTVTVIKVRQYSLVNGIRAHILQQGRDLAPKDKSGTSDPVCYPSP